jgi:hypothetical protein
MSLTTFVKPTAAEQRAEWLKTERSEAERGTKAQNELQPTWIDFLRFQGPRSLLCVVASVDPAVGPNEHAQLVLANCTQKERQTA